MSDYILRAVAGNGSVRAFAANTRETVETARKLHKTSPTASAALGRSLTAAAMMGSMLKNDTDLITLQIKGDGPLGSIVVTGDSKGRVKGYVFNPEADVEPKYPGKLDVGKLVGKGYLNIIKDIGLKEPYNGQIELISGEIAEDLTYYFAVSEQTPSTVGLGVLVDVDCSIKQAGGFIIQLMPDADEEVISKLENKLKVLPDVTSMLDSGLMPEDILKMLLGDQNLEINDKIPVGFYCNCSRSKVEKALISLGKSELESMIKEDKKASVKCHFCNSEYNFTEEELKKLLSEATH